MKTIVAGSRSFNDYDMLEQILHQHPITEIVSGTARGADRLGEQYAEKNGIPVRQFPADWEKYGKWAGYRRNILMVDFADALIAFWDGKSKGTENMIDLARDMDLWLTVIRIDK